jgi:prepilin-type N-terminal cleavage/methylation domain-containing protein
MRKQEEGFSLLEVVVVLALVLITATIAVMQIKTMMAALDADKASNLVVSQMGYARQMAVDQRRNVSIGFQGNNEIKVTRLELGGGTTLMSDVTLPAGYTFGFPPGVVDTPDGYLSGSALYSGIGTSGTAVFIGAGTTGTFLGDGTFVDSSNVLLNGSVFTKGSGNGTARAVTLSGSTGRVKQYWVQGTTWMVR